MNRRTLLDSVLYSGCSSTIVMIRLISEHNPKKDSVMKCNTQAGNINTDLIVKIDFTLPEYGSTNIMM